MSSFRNLIRLKSEHFFNENGREYKVVTNMKSILRRTLEVALYCNDELVQIESVTYAKKGTFRKDFWKGLWIYILLGAITGGLIGYFDLINWFGVN